MNERLKNLLDLFEEYRSKRLHLLSMIGIPDSCRDPLSEFSEVLVARLLNAKPAKSRVQKGYDLITPQGEKVEVKYLSNPKDRWINWHIVTFNEMRDKYALVYYEDLKPKAVFIFPRNNLDKICKALGKRHGKTDTELQFTKTNYLDLTTNPNRFRRLGVDIYLF